MGYVKAIFEKFMWSTRFFVLFAVLLSLVGALLLFVVASTDIIQAAWQTYLYYTGQLPNADLHTILLNLVILSIDLYLIAVVLLIFAFGLYELFISKIEIKNQSSSNILEIHNLDQLKDKLAKVIVMALIVAFFSKVLNMNMQTTQDMLFFAISILALSIGLYFLHKDSKH